MNRNLQHQGPTCLSHVVSNEFSLLLLIDLELILLWPRIDLLIEDQSELIIDLTLKGDFAFEHLLSRKHARDVLFFLFKDVFVLDAVNHHENSEKMRVEFGNVALVACFEGFHQGHNVDKFFAHV